MKMYDVPGYDTPKMLSEEHAEELGATEHVEVEQPSARASKSEWVEYAIARGADAAEAEELTKQQLVEQFGS